VQRECPEDRLYGTIHSQVDLSLDHPLVHPWQGGRVVVPVLEETELPIRGRLRGPAYHLPARMVILLDISSSTSTRIPMLKEDGSIEWSSARAAEHRSLERLLDWVLRYRDAGETVSGEPATQIGIIAFGEGTWPVAEPGTSIEEIRGQLESRSIEWIEGVGRTDAVCALRLANDWLKRPPKATSREILLLTDGDLPFSGRFTDCDAPWYGRPSERAACLASLNASICPASHELRSTEGRSDVAQLFSFVREVRGEFPVFPVLFRLGRAPRFYRELARYTGGQAFQLGLDHGVERAISSFLEMERHQVQIVGVFAHNLQNGEATENLLGPNRSDFSGALPLNPGSNDVELRVESAGGPVALFRFRLYAVADPSQGYLRRLREANHDLERRFRGLVDGVRKRMRAPIPRDLEVTTDGASAVTEDPPHEAAVPSSAITNTD
jgi:hypothetical protein